MIPRRSALLLPFVFGVGCAMEPSPPTLSSLEANAPDDRRPSPMLLDVATFEVARIPEGAAFFVIPPAPIDPVDAFRTMAADSFRAAGASRSARLHLRAVRLGLHPYDQGRVSVLTCVLYCTLEILSRDNRLLGAANAGVNRGAKVPASSPAELAESEARFQRIAMAQLQLELESQVRRSLSGFLLGEAAAS
jgi:hypothetical protein